MPHADENSIRLDQFLKLSQCVQSGGEAKVLIQAGEVRVNGVIETRRRRKLVPGDRILCQGEEVLVLADGDPAPDEAE